MLRCNSCSVIVMKIVLLLLLFTFNMSMNNAAYIQTHSCKVGAIKKEEKKLKTCLEHIMQSKPITTHVVLQARQENYFLHYQSTTEQNPKSFLQETALGSKFCLPSVRVQCLIAQSVSQSVKSIKASFSKAQLTLCQVCTVKCFVRKCTSCDSRQMNWLYSSQADSLKSLKS